MPNRYSSHLCLDGSNLRFVSADLVKSFMGKKCSSFKVDCFVYFIADSFHCIKGQRRKVSFPSGLKCLKLFSFISETQERKLSIVSISRQTEVSLLCLSVIHTLISHFPLNALFHIQQSFMMFVGQWQHVACSSTEISTVPCGSWIRTGPHHCISYLYL